MSAETVVVNVLDQLTALAAQYQNQAVALAKAAADRINGTGPGPDPYGIQRTPELPPDGAAYPRPAVNLDLYTPPATPELESVPIRTRHFTASVPDLDWNPTGWRDPQSLKITPAQPPTGKIELAEVVAPELEDPELPTLTAPPTRWDSPDVAAVFPDLPVPNFADYTGQDFAAALDYALALFRPYLNDAAALEDRIAAVRASLSAALDEEPDFVTYETERYQQAMQDAELARRAALEQLDAQPGTVVGLPDGKRLFGRLMTDFGWDQAGAKAAFDARNARLVLELAWLSRLRPVQARLLMAALDWGARSLALVMQAVDAAVDAMTGALEAAQLLYELEGRELTAFVRYNEAQGRVFDGQRQVALAQVRKVRAALAGEQLKAKYNANASRAFELAATTLERRAALYATQADYVAADVATRTVRLEMFEAVIKQQDALAQLKIAEHGLRRAQIRNDLTAVSYQLRLIEQATAQVEKNRANVHAATLKIKEQGQHNQTVLARYTTELTGYLEQYRLITDADRVLLDAWVAGHDANEKSTSLELQQTTLENTVKLQEALRDLERDRVRITSELKRRRLRVSKQAAQATAQAGGASVLAGIGQSAASGMNALGIISRTD